MKSFYLLGICLTIFASFTTAAPKDRNLDKREDDDWYTGISGRLSGRKGKGTESETETFRSSRLNRFSIGQRRTGSSSDSDFDLESFVGFGKVSGGENGDDSGADSIKDGPTVIETESRAHVDSEGKVSAGGVSGIAGASHLSNVDLESAAGVSEDKGFGRSSSRALGNRGGFSRGSSEETGHEHVGAVSAAASSNGGEFGVGLAKNSRRESGRGGDLFVRSSLSRRGEESKITGRSEGFGDSGSFGIVFEDKED